MVTTKAAARVFARTATGSELRAEARRVRREADRLYDVADLLDAFGDDDGGLTAGTRDPTSRTRSTGPSAKKAAKKAAAKKVARARVAR